LWDSAKAVSIDEGMNPSPGERRAGTQQHREHPAAGSRNQTAEGLAEVLRTD
jgi:hypothetical protein